MSEEQKADFVCDECGSKATIMRRDAQETEPKDGNRYFEPSGISRYGCDKHIPRESVTFAWVDECEFEMGNKNPIQ